MPEEEPTTSDERVPTEEQATPTLAGMGAIVVADGAGFRVWAPNATAVRVTGDFGDGSGPHPGDGDPAGVPLRPEDGGTWYGFVPGARAGQPYAFQIDHHEESFTRRDPYGLQVTNSAGTSVIYDQAAFDWQDVEAHCPPFHELVIYELHVGSFNADGEGEGDLYSALGRLDHLLALGVNAVQIMPVAEFAGDISWGYNPADPFAVESAYGGPDALKTFVRECHRQGLAVIQDVVYNHFGPSDLDLWRFDGWSENDKGGIYFFNDWRSATPWGETRPDYGREEVRRYILDNALMWLRDYRMDGLRFDMTPYIRSVDGTVWDIPEGWALTRRITDAVRAEFPGRILIAEDLHGVAAVTSEGPDGAGFHSQWDAHFVHPVREALTEVRDEWRSIPEIVDALTAGYGDAFARVVYTESHDEVANGKARVPQEIDPDDASGWAAQKRSTLGAALVMTAPGIPMLFQGQEFLEAGYFRDDVPLDWARRDGFVGIANLYRDLIELRLNRGAATRGLTGQHLDVFLADDTEKIVGYHRWAEGGPGDSTVVIVNLSHEPRENWSIAFPAPGTWRLRFNSDAAVYSALFADTPGFDTEATASDDGVLGPVSVGPYSVLIYSQDA